MLYKYRSLDNFKFFVDIILKKRLYAANYQELNDPMEGHYLYSNSPTSPNLVDVIKDRKQKLRNVSLSRNGNHPLMWSHYADGHRGVAVGIEVDRSKYLVKSIDYSNNFLNLDHLSELRPYKMVEQILSSKISLWSYEEEERILLRGGATFDYVKVKEVIAGRRMSNQDFGFIRDIINEIDSSIVVRRAYEYSDEVML